MWPKLNFPFKIKRPMKKILASTPLAILDAGREYLLASFALGDPVRWALRRDIDSSIIKNL